MTCSLFWENSPSQRQDLEEEIVSRGFRGLALGGKDLEGRDRKSVPTFNHMLFRFPVDFICFFVLELCESLRRLRELTMLLKQDFSFPFSSSIYVSVVLTPVARSGEKTEARCME
jgi:hypothetical protein